MEPGKKMIRFVGMTGIGTLYASNTGAFMSNK